MFPTILFFVIVLLNVLAFGRTIEYTEPIPTVSGSVRGEEVEVEGIKFKAFKGIPYAAPPVAEYRFSDPQPPVVWDNVKDVVRFGHICYQGSKEEYADSEVDNRKLVEDTMKSQNEDCLTLNVYTKKLGQEALQPVLFFIHGDTFAEGEGTDLYYGPEFLVDQDLVVVTFNFRLGPLGFLATGTEDAPGNWGLKDQAAALKWVNENIAQFGGDPKKVTIYGEGSGASSAHFHMLSPLSRGLFDKVILSSGTANSARALTSEQERFSENLAKYLGASDEQAEDTTKRVEFLRGVDARNLSQTMWRALETQDFENNLGLTIPFLPVLEPPETKNYFIIEEPTKTLSEGKFAKVPIMIGFDSIEGAFDAPLTTNTMKELDDNLCLVIPQHLREHIEEKDECKKVSEEMRRIYFKGKSIVDNAREDYTNLVGDLLFVKDITDAQTLHAAHSTEGQLVYNYYFTYNGEWNMMKNYVMPLDLPGAVRGDELFYLFNPRVKKLPLRKPSKAGLDTKARMISFISNFVKTGNPTPAVSELVPVLWEPSEEGKLNTMVIDKDIKMEQGVLAERMQFWKEIHERYDPMNDKE